MDFWKTLQVCIYNTACLGSEACTLGEKTTRKLRVNLCFCRFDTAGVNNLSNLTENLQKTKKYVPKTFI